MDPMSSILRPGGDIWGAPLVAPKPPKPQLQDGDIWFLLEFVSDFLGKASLTNQQRGVFTALLERLRGISKGMPPSVACAAAEWMVAFKARDPERVKVTGNALLDAVAASGDQPGAVKLQAAINEFTLSIIAYLEGQAPPGTDTADDDLPIEWFRPDPERYYALDKRSGAALQRAVVDLQPDMLRRHLRRGAEPPSKLFFVGEPGNGKTEAAMWIATQLGIDLAVVMLDQLVSKWMGETARKLGECAEAAKKRGAALLIDEIDSLGGRRDANAGDPGAGDHTVKVVSATNQILDRLPPEMIVIGATNLPDAVDPSVTRRLGTTIVFHNPDEETRVAMLTRRWSQVRWSQDAFDTMIRATNGRSGAALKTAAHAANLEAGRRSEDEEITEADVLLAISSLPKSTKLGEKPSGLLLVGR
jgi:hypothetical protein